VAHYTRKGTFGELAIMYTQPRAATCTAMTDVVCWAIGQSVFKVDIVTMTEKKRKDYAGFLQNVKILQTMKPEERDIVADALTAEEFQNGENICEEGTKGERFYVIKSGGCVCTQKQKSSDGSVNEVPVPDGDLAEGDYFGEISLLDPNKNRQATVTATQPTEVLWIDRNTFGRVLGPITDILQRNKAVYQSVALRLLAGDSKPNNTRGNN
jgi:cAMP-dependent protein kinase regulator